MEILQTQPKMKSKRGRTALMFIFESDRFELVNFDSDMFRSIFREEYDLKTE